MNEFSRTNRNVMTAVVIFGFLYLIFVKPESAPIPEGRVAAHFQEIIVSVANSVGGRVFLESCRMGGNVNFGVSCKVQGIQFTPVRELLLREGWRLSSSKPPLVSEPYGEFIREGEYFIFETISGESAVWLAAGKRRQ